MDSRTCPNCGRPIGDVTDPTLCHGRGGADCWRARAERAEARLADLAKQNGQLLDAIDKDASGLARALGEIRREVAGRAWVAETRGCYAWDDDRYKEEAGQALRAVMAIADEALERSGDVAREAWRTFEGGQIARLRARLAEVTAERDGVAGMLADANRDVFRLGEEAERLGDRLAEAVARLDGVERTRTEAHGRALAAEARLAEVADLQRRHHEERDHYREEGAGLRARVAELEGAVLGMKGERTAAERERDALAAKLVRLAAAVRARRAAEDAEFRALRDPEVDDVQPAATAVRAARDAEAAALAEVER